MQQRDSAEGLIIHVDKDSGMVQLGDANLGMIVDNHVTLQGSLATSTGIDYAARQLRREGIGVDVYYAP